MRDPQTPAALWWYDWIATNAAALLRAGFTAILYPPVCKTHPSLNTGDAEAGKDGILFVVKISDMGKTVPSKLDHPAGYYARLAARPIWSTYFLGFGVSPMARAHTVFAAKYGMQAHSTAVFEVVPLADRHIMPPGGIEVWVEAAGEIGCEVIGADGPGSQIVMLAPAEQHRPMLGAAPIGRSGVLVMGALEEALVER